VNKLYVVYWATPLHRGKEYIVAKNEEDVKEQFYQHHPRYRILEMFHVYNAWRIRWPVMWERIGKQYKEDVKKEYVQWCIEWKKVWKQISWSVGIY
jgi:hypothetical protein